MYSIYRAESLAGAEKFVMGTELYAFTDACDAASVVFYVLSPA